MRTQDWIVGTAFAIGLWLGARMGAPEASSRPPESRSAAARWATSYAEFERIEETFGAWADAYPDDVTLHRLAVSRDRRPLLALEIAPLGDTDRRPDERRTTVLFVGALDGKSLAGTQAAMRIADTLVSGLSALRRDVRILIVPAGSPDALARATARVDGMADGRNLRPIDDDGDGAFAEDPPDDVDGDGLVLEMLIEDPSGEWALAGNPRRLVRAEPGTAPRYRRVPEGRDDDLDGVFNEDGVGGIAFDEHFPIGWRGPAEDGPARGVRPLSEAVPRALAAFAVEKEVDLAVFLEGNHGGVALPPPSVASGTPHDDRSALAVRQLFARSSGRTLEAVTVEPAGHVDERHMMTWLHAAFGVRCYQVAVWGPTVVGADGRSHEGAAAGEPDLAWQHWIDEVRGGEGFVDWHPADVGAGRVALVGGFEPRTRIDPPEDLLDQALRGIDAFALELIAALPRLDIEVLELARHGDCVQVDARVVNRGHFPLDFAGAECEPVLSVRTTGGGTILAGDERVELTRLCAREGSETYSWLIRLPVGGAVQLSASAGPGREVVREVRP